jgi:flagellar biosynthesis protein FlhB
MTSGMMSRAAAKREGKKEKGEVRVKGRIQSAKCKYQSAK